MSVHLPDALRLPRVSFLHDFSGKSTSSIRRAMSRLEKEASAYITGVALFHFSEEQEAIYSKERNKQANYLQLPIFSLWRDWGFAGARQAAQAAHDARVASVALGAELREFQEVDASLLRQARRVLAETFPHAEEVRDSVAHPERFEGDKRNVAHNLDELGLQGRIAIDGCMMGDALSWTFKGRLIHCPISLGGAEAMKAFLVAHNVALSPLIDQQASRALGSGPIDVSVAI